MNNNDNILTWLNGRMLKLDIVHKNETVRIWECTDGISIEDAVSYFCETHNIDIAKEIGE